MPLCPDVLAKYKAHTFIETGTYHGRGIGAALEAGFQEVHSIELDEHRYRTVSQSQSANKKVHCHHGDSGEVLPKVIAKVKQPVTFWIDAHMGQKTYDLTNTPVVKEIAAIAAMPRNLLRAVLIDDMPKFSVEAQTAMEELLRKIDPKVVIRREHGQHKNNLLENFVMSADFQPPSA